MAIQTTYATGPDRGYPGMKADLQPWRVVTCKNADAVAFPFGSVIAFKASGATSDDDSVLPAATTAKLKAIVMQENDFARRFNSLSDGVVGELGTTGLEVGVIFDGMRAGTIWVTCEDGCVPGNPLFVRVAAGTLGACRATADSTNTIDATNCGTWLSTATAGGIALLEFDFGRKSGI